MIESGAYMVSTKNNTRPSKLHPKRPRQQQLRQLRLPIEAELLIHGAQVRRGGVARGAVHLRDFVHAVAVGDGNGDARFGRGQFPCLAQRLGDDGLVFLRVGDEHRDLPRQLAGAAAVDWCDQYGVVHRSLSWNPSNIGNPGTRES